MPGRQLGSSFLMAGAGVTAVTSRRSERLGVPQGADSDPDSPEDSITWLRYAEAKGV